MSQQARLYKEALTDILHSNRLEDAKEIAAEAMGVSVEEFQGDPEFANIDTYSGDMDELATMELDLG